MSKNKLIGDSPFLKRVLVPFWVVRILIMVVDIGIYGLAIGVVASEKSDLDDALADAGYSSQTTTTVLAILVVVMVLILACLVLDIVCIVKRSKRTLSPKFFLIVNVVQTLLWTILFALSMASARGSVALNIIIAIVVYLSFVGVLIYASVIFHRFRKGGLRGAYVPAANPALAEQGLAYNSTTAVNYPSYPSHTAYNEPIKQGHYEMDAQQPQTYGYPAQTQEYAPQTHGYPAQTQGYAPHEMQGHSAQTQGYAPQTQGYPAQQQNYPQYGNVA